MRKKIINFLLILAVLFTILPTFPSSAAASESTELNIYAMYLKPDTKGDSVLLESKGHYLLIDLATSEHVPSIIKQLNALGATHVDVLFSHLHKDHVGGASNNMLAGLVMLHAAGITVDTLYVADPSIAPLSLNNSKRYQRSRFCRRCRWRNYRTCQYFFHYPGTVRRYSWKSVYCVW